jgi:putative NADH-flavin reductase
VLQLPDKPVWPAKRTWNSLTTREIVQKLLKKAYFSWDFVSPYSPV